MQVVSLTVPIEWKDKRDAKLGHFQEVVLDAPLVGEEEKPLV